MNFAGIYFGQRSTRGKERKKARMRRKYFRMKKCVTNDPDGGGGNFPFIKTVNYTLLGPFILLYLNLLQSVCQKKMCSFFSPAPKGKKEHYYFF